MFHLNLPLTVYKRFLTYRLFVTVYRSPLEVMVLTRRSTCYSPSMLVCLCQYLTILAAAHLTQPCSGNSTIKLYMFEIYMSWDINICTRPIANQTWNWLAKYFIFNDRKNPMNLELAYKLLHNIFKTNWTETFQGVKFEKSLEKPWTIDRGN